MACVLGISAYYHDAAAALVVDGQLVAAIQEERLSRIKHDPGLPISAALACLAHAGLTPGDVDRVAFYEEPFVKLERVLVHLLRHVPRTWRSFPRALAGQLGRKLWVLDQLSESLAVPRERVVTCEHHRSHAASAFLVSPFPDAAVLVVDGVGEAQATTLWHGQWHGHDAAPARQRRLPPLPRPPLRRPHRLPRLRRQRGRIQGHGPRRLGPPKFRATFSRRSSASTPTAPTSSSSPASPT
jgi:predicted NodU family carbamoyl transferase